MKDLEFFFYVVSMLNPGLFLIAIKFGIIEWYEIYKKRWMPKKCEFCLFFWMTVLESSIYFSIFWHWGLLIIPVVFVFSLCSAVISRWFLA